MHTVRVIGRRDAVASSLFYLRGAARKGAAAEQILVDRYDALSDPTPAQVAAAWPDRPFATFQACDCCGKAVDLVVSLADESVDAEMQRLVEICGPCLRELLRTIDAADAEAL